MAIEVDVKNPIRAATEPRKDAEGEADGNEPVIIDLGKKSRKQVRKLRKGKPGRLLRRVEETIEQLRSELGENIRPVIIVLRQRPRRKGRRAAKMFGLG